MHNNNTLCQLPFQPPLYHLQGLEFWGLPPYNWVISLTLWFPASLNYLVASLRTSHMHIDSTKYVTKLESNTPHTKNQSLRNRPMWIPSLESNAISKLSINGKQVGSLNLKSQELLCSTSIMADQYQFQKDQWEKIKPHLHINCLLYWRC